MLRRNFLATATAGAVTATATAITLGGHSLFAQDAAVPQPAGGRKIKLALLGCGGRGAWIGRLFQGHGGYEIHAVGDYFPGRATRTGGQLKVPASRCFSGLNAYKRLLETKPDAIAIIVAPWFHPKIVETALDAGVHVYLAKPVAVDVPGCYSIEASGKRATEKKLCFLVDFQTRTNKFYIEAMRRVNSGTIGERIFGEAFYHADSPGSRAKPGSHGERIANWRFYRDLGGDIIVERDIHVLDVVNWAMDNVPPLHAFGVGGRKMPNRPGDANDYATLHIQYPNNFGITFSSRETKGFGTVPEGIVYRMFCAKGVLETSYGGRVMVRGDLKTAYSGGKTGNIYEEGAVANIAEFHRVFFAKDYSNPTVAPSVRANLLTLLARQTAYTNKLVTWDELLKDTNRLDADLRGLKD
ncbi:MAG: Gfo/Idh/MocA family oxidoreductase [Puniceicoccales bacterium]|nr:Gfo/Idh/MocA family oxidoreductase [Puniceicoccales bacterium]